MYLPPRRSWQNKFGQLFDFDALAAHLLQGPLGSGSSCGGTHTLYALALLLQADKKHAVLSREKRRAVENYIGEAARRLSGSQSPDGSWNGAWAGSPDVAPVYRTQFDEILITGHQLDWMALVPAGLRVPRDQLAQAVRFVMATTLHADAREVAANPCPYVHGVRAALRLSGQAPPRGTVSIDATVTTSQRYENREQHYEATRP
jgi:hypothetical protein